MEAIETLHAITEPTRYRLLCLLLQHPYCVRALSKKLHISESAVSQHMGVLKRCQLVHGVKVGYQVHYQVDRQHRDALLSQALQPLSQPPARRAEPSRHCACEFMDLCMRRHPDFKEEPLP